MRGEAVMIGIPLGLAASNAGEWLIHKYLLHGLGKNKRSFWAFHWHEHHREARSHDMFDRQYVRSVFTWSPQGKEALALVAGAVVLTPLFPVAPFFTGTVWYRMARYYQLHKRAHLDTEWAKQHLPWHYDHHMGKDQNSNWCVTYPWFDHVRGTRKRYTYDPHGRPVKEDVVSQASLNPLRRYWKSLFAEPKGPVPTTRLEAVDRPAAA